MALVAYDSSDYSESEDDNDVADDRSKVQTKATFSPRNECGETTEISPNPPLEATGLSRPSLFAGLPPPRSRLPLILIPETVDDIVHVPNENDSRLRKIKDSKPVKIIIPSLAELAEGEEPSSKKLRVSSSKSLCSVLPPPKYSSRKVSNRPLIPYSVKPKGAPPKVLPQKPSSKEQSKKNLMGNNANDSDDDDDLNETHDFFSLDSVGKIPDTVDATSSGVTELQEPIASVANPMGNAFEQVSTSSSENFSNEVFSDSNFSNKESNFEASSSIGPASSDLSSMMSDEGFLRLGGTKRRGQQDIQFIDVVQDDQLPSAEEWKRKALMEKTGYRPSRKKGSMPTSQQRKKHQITYLAFQAKEREMELQEQWAQNRFTRHQTQSKYGF